MPKKPKTSHQDAAATPAPDVSSTPPASAAADTAAPAQQDADLDLYSDTPAGFSEVDGEIERLPER